MTNPLNDLEAELNQRARLAQDESQFFEEGYKACKAGKPLSVNPYRRQSSAAAEYARGYARAEQEKAKGQDSKFKITLTDTRGKSHEVEVEAATEAQARAKAQAQLASQQYQSGATVGHKFGGQDADRSAEISELKRKIENLQRQSIGSTGNERQRITGEINHLDAQLSALHRSQAGDKDFMKFQKFEKS